MTTLLRIGGPANRGRYWLATNTASPSFGEHVYFVYGCDTLADRGPTWFDTEEEAIAAAEAMGFTVMQ